MAEFRSDDNDDMLIQRAAQQHLPHTPMPGPGTGQPWTPPGPPVVGHPDAGPMMPPPAAPEPDHYQPASPPPRSAAPADMEMDEHHVTGYGAPLPGERGQQQSDEQLAQLVARLRSADPALAEQLVAGMQLPPTVPESYQPEPEPERFDPLIDSSDLATLGWRGWLVRNLHLPIKKNAAEKRLDKIDEAADLIMSVRSRISSPIVIGVSSFKGGCGKTPLSLVLASLLRDILGEDIAVVDADENGSLVVRSDDLKAVDRGRVGAALLASRIRSAQAGPIRSYFHQASRSGLWILPGAEPGSTGLVAPEDYSAVLSAVLTEFRVVIVDMGHVAHTALYAGIVSSLTALIMVTPPETGPTLFLESATSKLTQLGARTLGLRQIVMVNNLRRLDGDEVSRYIDRIKLMDRQLADHQKVGYMPYDAHIGTNDVIDPAQISMDTKASVIFAAGDLFSLFIPDPDGQ